MVERLSDIILAAWLSELDSLKANCDRAIAQLSEDQLHARINPQINPIATIMRHITGNLTSRFTDFLSTDGEKPSRNRDGEFRDSRTPRPDLLANWNAAWSLARTTIASLSEDDLDRSVIIRSEHHTVPRAIERAISHMAYHTGQILMLSRIAVGENWQWITIAPGKSQEFLDAMRAKNAP